MPFPKEVNTQLEELEVKTQLEELAETSDRWFKDQLNHPFIVALNTLPESEKSDIWKLLDCAIENMPEKHLEIYIIFKAILDEIAPKWKIHWYDLDIMMSILREKKLLNKNTIETIRMHAKTTELVEALYSFLNLDSAHVTSDNFNKICTSPDPKREMENIGPIITLPSHRVLVPVCPEFLLNEAFVGENVNHPLKTKCFELIKINSKIAPIITILLSVKLLTKENLHQAQLALEKNSSDNSTLSGSIARTLYCYDLRTLREEGLLTQTYFDLLHKSTNRELWVSILIILQRYNLLTIENIASIEQKKQEELSKISEALCLLYKNDTNILNQDNLNKLLTHQDLSEIISAIQMADNQVTHDSFEKIMIGQYKKESRDELFSDIFAMMTAAPRSVASDSTPKRPREQTPSSPTAKQLKFWPEQDPDNAAAATTSTSSNHKEENEHNNTLRPFGS